MKILWIVGGISLFPEALSLLSGETTDIKETGGWIAASARMIQEDESVTLGVAFVTSKVKAMTILKGKGITYYLLPEKGIGVWSQVIDSFKPNVVHIHGTENHDNILRFFSEYKEKNVVISMQGIRNAIMHYANSGISFKEKLLNITLRDILRSDLLISKRKLKTRGYKETLILSLVQHVIGRTISDRSYVWSINPKAKYHFCNETLREEFYLGGWSYSECVPHTIFLSQGYRPLKGLHIFLKALPLVRRSYPDLKVKIAGGYFTNNKSIKDKLKISGYGKLILKEIKRLGLDSIIEFVGPLNAEGMKQEYLRANIFVNPSTIENSPNSLCEAQILGVPCLSSYVGGVPDMIPNPSCGEMYRFDEIEVLAYKMCRLFETSKDFDNRQMRKVALQRHDPKTNVEALKDIYLSIINSSKD